MNSSRFEGWNFVWCNFHVMPWYTYKVPLLGRLKGESQIKSFLRLAIKPGYCFVTNGREHALRQSKWHSFWRRADARKVCFKNSFTVANLNCQLSSQKQTNKKLFPKLFPAIIFQLFPNFVGWTSLRHPLPGFCSGWFVGVTNDEFCRISLIISVLHRKTWLKIPRAFDSWVGLYTRVHDGTIIF